MSSGGWRLLGKLALLSLPFGLWLLVYLITDPFWVLRAHPQSRGLAAAHSRDYLSTESLLRQYRQQGYDSFILGNSRTLGFRSQDWSEFLPTGSVVFSYGSYSDSLYGIAHKLELIDRLGLSIHNLLLVFDYTSVVGVEDSPAPFLRKHPLVSGTDRWGYQLKMAQTFFTLESFHSLRLNLGGGDSGVHYDDVHGDIVMHGYEKMLAEDEDGFYRSHGAQLQGQTEIAWGPVVSQPEQFRLLESMRRLLDKHRTSYKVVLVPSLPPVRLHPQDVDHLRRIFGADQVFDYTPADDLTRDPHNWYDPMHFRPQLGRRMLREVYRRPDADRAPDRPASSRPI